jgi:chaperonin GroES
MKIVPLGDKVVVKRLEAAERTAGGILLPDSSREKPQQGKVLSVGVGKLLPSGERRTLQVSEGDRVLFSTYAGIPVQVDDEELFVMNEADILAVVETGRS